jgi:hypothetical protein
MKEKNANFTGPEEGTTLLLWYSYQKKEKCITGM